MPRPIHVPPHPGVWQELSWPAEYPLAQNELSFLLPHFLKDGRGKPDTYFIRVYNPVWTNPDGLSWMEVLTDTDKVGCFVALTPTWNESAYFADYVLPMGVGGPTRAREAYRQWLKLTRPARITSPDGTRRPRWLMRPLKPSAAAFRLPDSDC